MKKYGIISLYILLCSNCVLSRILEKREVTSQEIYDNEEEDVTQTYQPEPNYGQIAIASVKNSMGFHACNGFFIKTDQVVTTAKCVLTLETVTSFVDVMVDNRVVESQLFVKSLMFHSGFELDPHRNDIALIGLKTSSAQATLFKLPLSERPLNKTGRFITWVFDNSSQIPSLNVVNVYLPSLGLCSELLDEYVGSESVCIEAKKVFKMAPADQGTPVFQSSGGEYYVLGMYNKIGMTCPSKWEKFMNIYPFNEWIKTSGNLP